MSPQQPTTLTPAFGIIAPTAYLEQYATRSKFHLTLAHLVDVDEQYAAFYRQMSSRGDFIICDNGAFELGQSYEPSKLIELGKKCGAHALVLPDYPGEHWTKTVAASQKMIAAVKDAGFQTMFVPQSDVGDIHGWIQSYTWAAENSDIDIIGMSILACPSALPHIHKSYARVVMTQLLMTMKKFNPAKYHHYLGANAGLALEIPTLIKMRAMNSCDSSNPVWMAILGHEYTKNSDSYLPTKKIHMPVQFDYKWSPDAETHRRINHNLTLALELFTSQY